MDELELLDEEEEELELLDDERGVWLRIPVLITGWCL